MKIKPMKNKKEIRMITALFLIALMLFIPVYSAQALTISNIRVRNITSNSADILWDTDVAADSMVKYGNYSYREFSASDAALVTEHSVTLNNLLSDSKYYYSITSAAGSDSATKGGDNYYFYTNVGDIIAPVISSILVSTTETTATISWTTNEAATSKIYYGETTDLGNDVSVSGMLTQHNVQLTDLTNNTQYFYVANSCDAYNNCANSSLLSFVAQSADTMPPFINATIPAIYGSSQLDISGRTEAYTTVQLYQNDVLKRAMTTDHNGTFSFPDVVLDPAYVPNKIRLHAKDASGNENDANYNITADLTYPFLDIEQIPTTSQIQTLTVNGTVDKNSTIKFYVSLESFDKTPPPAVENLSQSIVTASSIKITWNAVNVTDLSKYAVYRSDVGRIATTFSNYFTDVIVSTNKTYAYQVSAIDSSGNEGIKSALLYITTLAGGSTITQLPPVVELDIITPQAIKNNVLGNFSQGLALQTGYNKIKIEATDNIGHTTTYENITLYDPNPPVIQENNIGALNPSYIPDVTIRGKVNKNATVYVYLNYANESSYETATEQDGTFSINIELSNDASLEEYETTGIAGTPGSGVTAGYTPAYVNKIKLIAKDSVGRESTPIMGDIKYTQCGFGSWWQVNISDATPDILTPRLMMLGMAEMGITAQLGWQGGYTEGSIMTQPTVSITPLSAEQKEKYDIDWLKGIPTATWSGDKKTGYILIKLKALDPSIANATSLDKENNLSDHRKDECPIPGLGCIKIPLMLEIKFYDPNLPGYSISPGIAGTQGTQTQTQTLTQKQCWDVIVNIDRRVPSDKIPKAFLASSVEFLNVTIDLIDMILKPLNQVKTWVFYGCAGSWAYSLFTWFSEKWDCEFSGGLGTIFESLIGQTNSMKKVAEQGLCDQAFSDPKDDDKKQACKSCSDAIKARINWDQAMHWVCDRIFCPSAPTLQNYVEEKKKEGKDLFSNLGKKEKIANADVVNSNSDCALVKATDTGSIGKDEVKKIYTDYNDQQNKADCTGLHPYDPKCCGFEYMREWDSACGALPKFGFNELEESYCLVHPEDTAKCSTFKKIVNAAAGFCDPQGKPKEEYISGLRTYKALGASDAKDTEALGKEIFYRIKEETDGNGKTIGVTVERGYYHTKYVTAQQGAIQVGQPSKITQEAEFKPLRTVNEIKDVDVIDRNNPQSFYNTNLKKFENDYVSVAVDIREIPGVSGTIASKDDAKTVFDKILSSIGTTDKKYIVDPTSSLIRSVQCACLPGITSYLSLYRSMMDAIRTCFNTILLTGDGNPGVCQAVLTQYVCDLLYDVIKCFTKKYSSGFGKRFEGGIGGFLSALTSAGTSVQRSISGRYGASTIWRTMFAERKLVHAICLFAFTGDWNLDVNTFLNENISVNIQSQPILFPCTRRFISYNPVTSHATWNYHLGIGLVAGSPLNYRVYLKCSDDYSCNSAEGFEGGKCDCIGGEQTASVNVVGGNGVLTAGQILDSDTYYQIEAGTRYSQVRYDTAVLEWTWTNNNNEKVTDKQECRISQEGSAPPAFCSFDIGTGSYLCRFNVGRNLGEAYFEGDPYVRPDPFKKDENLQISVRIAQQLPSDAKERQYEYCAGGTGEFCSYTKQLRWSVMNQNNVVISEMSSGAPPNQPVIKLSENKQHQFTLPNVAITKEMFERTSATTTTTKTCTNVGKPAGSSSAHPDSITVASVKCDDTFELIYNAGKTNDNDKFEYKIGAYSSSPTPTFTSTQTTNIKCSYDKSQRKVTCGTNEITISSEPNGNAATVFYSGIQSTQSPTTTFNCDNKEQPWTAVFALYDYKKDDATGQYIPSEQITMSNNGEQKKTMNFKVICDPSKQGTGVSSAGPTIISSFTVGDKTDTLLVKKNDQKDAKITTTEDSTSAYMSISGPISGSVTLEQEATTSKKVWVTKALKWAPTMTGKYTLQGHVTGGSLNAQYVSQNTITAYVWEKECKDKNFDTNNKKGICFEPENSKCPNNLNKIDETLTTDSCTSPQICCQYP